VHRRARRTLHGQGAGGGPRSSVAHSSAQNSQDVLPQRSGFPTPPHHRGKRTRSRRCGSGSTGAAAGTRPTWHNRCTVVHSMRGALQGLRAHRAHTHHSLRHRRVWRAAGDEAARGYQRAAGAAHGPKEQEFLEGAHQRCTGMHDLGPAGGQQVLTGERKPQSRTEDVAESNGSRYSAESAAATSAAAAAKGTATTAQQRLQRQQQQQHLGLRQASLGVLVPLGVGKHSGAIPAWERRRAQRGSSRAQPRKARRDAFRRESRRRTCSAC